MKRLGLTALLVIVLSELGCSQFHEYADERLTASRNRHLAKQAWQRVEGFHCQQTCLDDFGDGYQAGYFDALGGGNGCPPALPPKRYWRVCFQNPIGHLRIESWFEGFRQGATAAKQDGVANWIEIPTSIPKPREQQEQRAQEASPPLTPVPPVSPPPASPEAKQPLRMPEPPKADEQTLLPDFGKWRAVASRAQTSEWR